MQPTVDFGFALEILPTILLASIVTAKISFLSSLIAIIIGIFGFLSQQSPLFIVSRSVRELMQFIRSTPLLLQIYFFYFTLPELGFDLEPLIAGSIVLGLHYSCYIAEVFRSALLAIDRGQQEASRALGLRRFLVYRLVIFPQMLPLLVPDVGNAIIALVKDTPILSAISVMEMLAKTKEIGADTFRYVEPMTICGIIYLIISYVLAIIIKIIRSQFSWIRATR